MSDLLDLIERLPQSQSRESSERTTEDVAAVTPRARFQIGRYDIVEQLGCGAYGFVLRAFDPVFRRPCALKVPYPGVLAEPNKRQRFLNEPRTLDRLGQPTVHPNIVRVYDADECGGVCYIAMELCESGSLADWLRHLPDNTVIPVYWACELVRMIAGGVQHAHERKIYHRDLKPANILLTLAEATATEDGEAYEVSDVFPRFCPKVGDFGLSKILGDDELTVDGAMIGTKPYMSPEQIRGDSASVGPAADIWALGVILYELLTRRRPFEGPDEQAYRDQICGKDPIAPRVLRRDLPRGLETVCLKCLEKSPSDRYLTPSELANDLIRVLDKVDPLGRTTPYWKRLVRKVKRHPVRAALVSLSFMTVLIAAEYVEHRQASETDLLIRQLEVTRVADLPVLVPKLSASDNTVANRLKRLFVNGNDNQKIAFALVLAERFPEFVDYCFLRLLEARPEDTAPIARLLNDRTPRLISQLNAVLDAETPPVDADKERFARHRANAACALSLLGSDERTWSLLRSDPDPQARTILIHSLGPAGVAPSRLVDRLENPGTDNSVKVALIQSLGSVGDSAWEPNLRDRVKRWLLDRYRNDPDAGIHGTCKWLLRNRWKSASELERIDRELAGKSSPGPGFRWRISGEGLTLITVDDPALDRVIEVSDTEVTAELYARFNQSRPLEEQSYSIPEISPTDSCPVNGVSYFDAAAFCNWLSKREQLSDSDACYRQAGWREDEERAKRQMVHEPAPDNCNRRGFRLPTNEEFDAYCAAGTVTRRYHGNSDVFFDRYAWTLMNTNGETHPVASLIPNGLGLFDTLGNVVEWCDSRHQRGGWASFAPPTALDRSIRHGRVAGFHRDPTQGFRVVRTTKVRKPRV
jgi:serine/threonine protein kinase